MTAAVEEAESRDAALKSELKDMSTRADERATRVRALEEEVTNLKKKVKETTSHIDILEGELQDMTEKAEGRAARVESLESELSGMTTTANEAKARVEFLETELGIVTSKAEQLQTDLATASQDLESKNTRLTELDSYRVSLRSETEDTYVQILDTIWTSIAGLVETQFRQNLDHSVLTDESCWANLRQSEYLKHAHQIPLPQSNSSAAKQMRVAAVLAVLSRALHRYIFRPVYLTEYGAGDDGIVNMLRAIACDNTAREEHTRAMLLAMLPDKQKAAAAKRVSAVVREVSWSVQHLLSALQYEAFCTGLETACKLACVQWMRIQVAQMKIEPYFGPPYEGLDWQTLPLPGFDGAEEGVHLHGDGDYQEGVAVADDTDDIVVEIGRPVEDVLLTPKCGGRVIDQEDQASFGSSPRPMNEYDEDSEVGPDEIMLVVWPSMCVLENRELESITQGLVISKDQARAALDEVRGRGRQRPATKRARTLSMPGRGVSGSAGTAFLSQGAGDESKDG
jgi:predicted  nucleic acid-binding Zn-ribbon protein